MIYLSSAVILIIAFMLLQKFEKRQNFWRSLAMAIMAYECYLCMIAGVMTVIHIPVDIYSVSVINIASIVCIGIIIYKKRKVQSYYINIFDSIFVFFLAMLVGYLFVSRFTTDLKIIFQTSDPGTHLKMAMNFVNTKSVDGMYIGQLMNGLMIESLIKIFPGELAYKSLIIQCGINLFMAGMAFWAVVQRYGSNMVLRLLTFVVTVAYVLGYPYNDMLYGFVYLQMTITVVCFLIALMQDYVYEKVNIWLWGVLVGASCLSVSIGYTLFAPPVYISVLLFVAYKAYRENWLKTDSGFPLNKKFILCALDIFLLPTFLTLWIILILPKINGTATDYGVAMLLEGAIYRNLYSDFLLYAIPAFYGIVCGVKKRKLNLLSFMFPIFGIYYLFFLFRMLMDKVSTYYFYKLNYLFWMLLLVSFVIGMKELIHREKTFFASIMCGMILLAAIYISGFESNCQNKNINYLPYADTNSFFRIYNCNKEFEEAPIQMADGLVEVSGVVNRKYKEQDVVFVGYWQDVFWYEALTNQRFPGLHYYTYAEVFEMFKAGQYGEYAVIKKDSEGLEAYQQLIQDKAVYENEYAYIIKR